MTELQEDLSRSAERLKWKGKRNYLFAYLLYAIAALSSAGASIWAAALVAVKRPPPFWFPILAALPAAAIYLNDTLQLEEKARWCYEKRNHLKALLRKSKFAQSQDSMITEEWNALEIRLEKSWPRFGRRLSQGFRPK